MQYFKNYNSDLSCQICTKLLFWPDCLDKSEVKFHKRAGDCHFSLHNLLKNTFPNLNIHFTVKMDLGAIV